MSKFNKEITPADEGIAAAKHDVQKQIFLSELCDEFKSFVVDSLQEGMLADVDDHFDFLEHCLEVFRDMKEGE